jgi:hypothetical protein
MADFRQLLAVFVDVLLVLDQLVLELLWRRQSTSSSVWSLWLQYGTNSGDQLGNGHLFGQEYLAGRVPLPRFFLAHK